MKIPQGATPIKDLYLKSPRRGPRSVMDIYLSKEMGVTIWKQGDEVHAIGDGEHFVYPWSEIHLCLLG